MKIELHSITGPSQIDALDTSGSQAKRNPGLPTTEAQQSDLYLQDIQQVLDKATGLIQTIVADKISEDVIRKLPPDEYLEMLTLMNKMIDGSVDDEA